MTGSPTVRVRVSGAPDVTLFAKIYDVDQAGQRHPAQSAGVAGAGHRAQAGRVVTIALPAIDYDFSTGHRLRLVLTTTDYGYATPPRPPSTGWRWPAREWSCLRPGPDRGQRRGALVGMGGAAAALAAAALILASAAAAAAATWCPSWPGSRWRSPG